MTQLFALILCSVLLQATTFTTDQLTIKKKPLYTAYIKGTTKKATGLFKTYYDDNKTVKEIIPLNKGYINGTYQSFYPSGIRNLVADYIHSQRNGSFIVFYENRQKAYEAPMINEKKNGNVKAWYKNGQLQYNIFFKDDKAEGLVKVFTKNGEIESINEYKDGIVIKQIQPKKPNNYKLQTRALSIYGKGKDIYYLFISPLCPHCHEFMQNIQKFKDNATFYIYLIPLDKKNLEERKILDIIYSKRLPEKMLQALLDFEKGNLDLNQTVSDENIYLNNSEILKAQQMQLEVGIPSVPQLIDTKGFKYTVNQLYSKYHIDK